MTVALRRRAKTVASVIMQIFEEVRDREVPFMAGSIAYHAFLSLFPFLLLVFLAVSTIGNEQLAAFVESGTEAYLTPTAQSLVLDSIRKASGRVQLSVIAVLTLVWGVTGVFRGLDTAFSRLYRTGNREGLVEKTIDGLIVILGMVIATIVMFLAGTVYALFPRLPFVNVLNLALLTVALAITFAPIYYVFPDAEVSVVEILPGAFLAAVGWTLLQVLFQLYASLSSTTELYGVLGGILLLITWLYFGALVLLVGGATNVVLSSRAQTRSQDDTATQPDE